MYSPDAFKEDRTDVLLEAMQYIQFATLVTPNSESIEVTHVPLFAKRENDHIILESHIARANPHWKSTGATVAIFQGPQAYVTPSWYPSKQAHGKVVPTWAYIAVHAHGKLEAIEDDVWLRRHLNDLTDANETPRDAPWKVDDAPEPFIGSLSRGIVGLRLKVDRLEGKWKINQNKTDADVEGTRAGLAENAGADGQALAEALQNWSLHATTD